jgi:ribosomal protein S18 acetylase RimI-like enzyme
MADDQLGVRPYRPGDLDDLYRVCLRTADIGQDATAQYRDPAMPGHVYAAPYGLFEPGLAFVAVDEQGVAGYIVGALDSRAFAERLEASWWPRLRGRYPAPPPDLPFEERDPEQRTAGNIHRPFPVTDELAGPYPSHLHINLLPRLQGQGQGRALMTAFLAALRARQSRGVHLHVDHRNHRAAQFYEHLGFTLLPVTGVRVYGMDLASAS